MNLEKKENGVYAMFFKILCLLIYIFFTYISLGKVHLNMIYVDIWKFKIFIFFKKGYLFVWYISIYFVL